MTTIQNDTPVAAAQAASPLPGPQPGGTALSADFETFLVMLTAQLQNQDPLNPMESTDFATQLATFSGVEQQVRTNTLLEGMGRDAAGGDLARLAEWVGREVRAPAPAWFDGSPIEVFTDIPGDRGGAQLRVRDESGAEVQRMPLQAGSDAVLWQGRGPGDTTLPWGRYRFDIVTGEADGTPRPAEVFTRVQEARIDDGAPVLVVAGGTRLPAAEVTAVR